MLLIAAQVILLGTGTPNAEPDRSGPSVAIVANNQPYIVDFGPGIVRRAVAANLKPSDLKIAFATHLHSDHTAGLPDLILTPWTLEREVPLELYGPKGIASMANHVEQAYKADIQIRLHGGEPSNKTGWKVNAHEIKPGVVFHDQNVTVTAIKVPHGAWGESYAYRFDTSDGRSIVISGDTGPTEAVAQLCNACDILIHEVYSTAGFARRPKEWQQYHAKYHTSSAQLAELAKKAHPKLLVLTHLLSWGTTDKDLLSEVTSLYPGKVAIAHDLDIF
jgi:ribonuclease BN (tRNA processing enzyme)